jgi:cytochrome P450
MFRTAERHAMSDERPHADPEPVPTGAELTALDPAFRADPYPALARLRRREPVHHDQLIGRFILTRADDIERVLRDRSMSVDPRKANAGTFMRIFERFRTFSILFQDPPEHTRLRGLVSQAFTPRAVERLGPRIREIIDELLGAVAGRDRLDVIEAFAGPLPVIVIAEMLGVDPADRQDFKRWSDAQALGLNPLLTADQQAATEQLDAELGEYLRRALAERRARPRDDLISALIAAEAAGDQLTDNEIVTMCELLLAAGNVTTTDLIGNGLWVLLRHPDQIEKLREEPSLIGNAVEEMLRFESPVMQTARIPMHDLEIGGCPIPRGESVMVLLAAANRDPGRYPEPDRFDITRQDVGHQSFGGGAHFCLGAPLARLEAQLAIAAFLQRFPRLRLADEPLEWRDLPGFRGLAKLWVRVD